MGALALRQGFGLVLGARPWWSQLADRRRRRHTHRLQHRAAGALGLGAKRKALAALLHLDLFESIQVLDDIRTGAGRTFLMELWLVWVRGGPCQEARVRRAPRRLSERWARFDAPGGTESSDIPFPVLRSAMRDDRHTFGRALRTDLDTIPFLSRAACTALFGQPQGDWEHVPLGGQMH